jgi:hypothetical protein
MTEKIPKSQLNAFYQKVGKTMADWLSNLECPTCKANSDIDWMLQDFSEGKPKLICRSYDQVFVIKGLGFKSMPSKESFAQKHYPELKKVVDV